MRINGETVKTGILAAGVAALGAWCLPAATDHSLSEFPRRSGEADDTPRFQRAVDACRGGGRLTVPAGDYAFASTLYVTNLCIVQMSPTAIVRAVKPMKWMVMIDCSWEYNSKTAPKDVYTRNFNLGWSGGILDGCGLASCLALDNYAHFTLENATFNNGRIYGVGVETRGRGYELIARNIYFHTSLPGLEGNTGLWAYAGDSHFIDIISVNYTTGIHLAGRGSNRMSRCHVWGTSTRPIVKGQVPETLKESVCFRIDATDVVLRDCYADTGNIGFWMSGWEERMECCSYAGLSLLKDAIVLRQNRGSIAMNGFYPRRISKTSTLYAWANDDTRIRWGEDLTFGHFTVAERNVPKEPTSAWAKKTWTTNVADNASAALMLIASADRWETTNEAEAHTAGEAAWARLSAWSPEKIVGNPFALYAVWRFWGSTLSSPGRERQSDEALLDACARAVEGGLACDDLTRTAVYSAAHDVTGSAKWRELEIACAERGLAQAEQMRPDKTAARDALKAQVALRLLRRSEKDPARKDRYRALLERNAETGLAGAADYVIKALAFPDRDVPVEVRAAFESAQANVQPDGAGTASALMAYWMERRHLIFLCR